MFAHAERSFAFSLLGHCCRVLDADECEEHWLRQHWHFDSCAQPTRAMHITLRFCHDAPRSTPPVTGLPQSTELPTLALVWRQHGPRWWSTGNEESGVELRLAADAVLITVWRDPGTPSTFPVEAALHVGMCEAVRATGLSPLHAAVITREGQATALAGKSGIGKSTALMIAMSQGWQPVAEDFSWLDPTNGRVYGWDRGVRLAERILASISPRWQQEGWQPAHHDKLFLSYENLIPRKQAAANLNRIALLHRDPTRPSAWEPLDLRAGVRMLCESVGVPLCRENRNYFADHLARLLARMEVARLVIGHTRIPF
jgi:hypothetical protein